jgi:hypothetical protein
MRHYDKFPIIGWGAYRAPVKASDRILHQESVIVQMPAS